MLRLIPPHSSTSGRNVTNYFMYLEGGRLWRASDCEELVVAIAGDVVNDL